MTNTELELQLAKLTTFELARQLDEALAKLAAHDREKERRNSMLNTCKHQKPEMVMNFGSGIYEPYDIYTIHKTT